MIEVELTPEMVKEAKKEAEELGVLKNSITKGVGNVVGILGEMAVAKVTDSTRANTRDYDLLRPDGKTAGWKNVRCEIKEMFWTTRTTFSMFCS